MTTRSIKIANKQYTKEEYFEAMNAYGDKKASTVRSARKYLREIGFKVDTKKGTISK